MKTTDLQIGDWVFNKHHKKHIQITPYDFFNHAHLPSGKQYFTGEPEVVSGRDFEPIPLTAEILKKNGFKEYEEDYHNEYVCEKCDETSYYEVVICWKDSYDNGALDAFNHVQWDESWKLDIISEGNYNKGWCKTIYLHELQHALRLCGLSELADNFKLEK